MYSVIFFAIQFRLTAQKFKLFAVSILHICFGHKNVIVFSLKLIYHFFGSSPRSQQPIQYRHTKKWTFSFEVGKMFLNLFEYPIWQWNLSFLTQIACNFRLQLSLACVRCFRKPAHPTWPPSVPSQSAPFRPTRCHFLWICICSVSLWSLRGSRRWPSATRYLFGSDTLNLIVRIVTPLFLCFAVFACLPSIDSFRKMFEFNLAGLLIPNVLAHKFHFFPQRIFFLHIILNCFPYSQSFWNIFFSSFAFLLDSFSASRGLLAYTLINSLCKMLKPTI